MRAKSIPFKQNFIFPSDYFYDLDSPVLCFPFLKRLFSVKQPPALVIVMDTTGSMFEEITAARRRALSIIQSRASNPAQSGTFLLVPFHDPGEAVAIVR